MGQIFEKELINLYNDVAFKWVFGREKESQPLIKLLNAIIDYDGYGPVFTEMEIKNPYDLNIPLSKQKQGILDIRAMDKNTGIWIDLEIEASSFAGAFKKKGILALKGSNIPAQGNSLNTVELRIKY